MFGLGCRVKAAPAGDGTRADAWWSGQAGGPSGHGRGPGPLSTRSGGEVTVSELWPILSPDETCPAPTPPHRGHEQQLRAPTRSHLLVDLGTFPPTCSWEAHSHSGMQPARGLCSTVLLGRSLRQSKSCVQRRERNLRSTLPALIWGCVGKVVSFVSNRPGLIPTFATPAWAASGSLPHLSE